MHGTALFVFMVQVALSRRYYWPDIHKHSVWIAKLEVLGPLHNPGNGIECAWFLSKYHLRQNNRKIHIELERSARCQTKVHTKQITSFIKLRNQEP